MNYREQILDMLAAAGHSGVPRDALMCGLKTSAFYTRSSILAAEGKLHIVKGGNIGGAMYFGTAEDAAAYLAARRAEYNRRKDNAKAEKRKQKRREKWLSVVDVLEAAGHAGMDRDELAAAAGISPKSVHSLVGKARSKLGTDAGMRIIGGRAVYFAAQFRPKAESRATQVPQKIIAAVAAAGPAGLSGTGLLAVISYSNLKRHSLPMRKAGKLFSARSGYGDDRIRYFSQAEWAEEFQRQQHETSQQAMREHRAQKMRDKRASTPKVPRRVRVLTRPLVLPKSKPKTPDPTSAIKAAPVVNPNKVRPVVLPSNPLWFEVTHAPQVVSANECRPWARYA